MNAVMNIEDAVVAKGIRAWSRIKATAAELRQLWREVGEALLVGRRMHKADRAFKRWCDEQGFDMSRGARADAMWYAEVYTACTPPAEMTHPTHIRQWFRDQAPAPSPEMSLDTPEPTVNLPAVAAQARKINALANSAAAGDETAKRHLEKKAKEFGGTVEEVVKTARAVAPELTVPADTLKTLEATKREVDEMTTYIAKYLISTQTQAGATPLQLEYAIHSLQRAYAQLTQG